MHLVVIPGVDLFEQLLKRGQVIDRSPSTSCLPSQCPGGRRFLQSRDPYADGMRRTGLVVLILAAVITACAETGTETTTSSANSVPDTDATTTTQPLIAGCPADEQFFESGLVDESDNTGSDSATIGLISWDADEACETFEIEFESAEGAPATTPPSVSARFLDDIGVLRVSTSASDTVITDQVVETLLVERLYVVRAIDGGTFIDFHLAGPAQARIELDNSPARLTLELQPGIIEYGSAPLITDQLVLISPVEGSGVPLDLGVSGYTRGLESDLFLIATQGNEVIDEVLATTASATAVWGAFSGSLELIEGEHRLFVGTEDAESGGFDGVSIDLQAG